MFVATASQIKIVDFIKKCNSKEKLLALILKNLEEFNPEYIEMENKLKNSHLKEKIDFKVYSYSFSQPKEIEHVAKYIEFEKPDIIIILSDTPIEGFNRKIFEKLQQENNLLLVKISKNKNKLNGNGYDIIYDAVFSSMEEAIDFFEKACFLLNSKAKHSNKENFENIESNKVYMGNVNDFFKNLSQQNDLNQLIRNSLPSSNTNPLPNATQARNENTNVPQDINIILVIETLKDLKDSIDELKKLVEKQNQIKRDNEKTKKSSNYSIVNLITMVLLLLLIGIIIFYK